MLLPDARRRGEVQFALARSLSYGRRLAVVLALVVAALAVQALWSVAAGAVVLLAATCLMIVRGFSNQPRALSGRREWRGATIEQVRNVLEISRKARDWDQAAIDITCASGVMTLIGLAIVVGLAAMILSASGLKHLAVIWVVDVAVLLLPHWVTGVREVLTNDPLVVKAKLLLAIHRFWQRQKQEGEAMAPQMEVIGAPGGELPCDAKLILRMDALGPDFLGVQVQVTINRVQGCDYPYLYCVLVARQVMGMLNRLHAQDATGVLVEPGREGDVDIVVVRLQTTRTGGYHTPPPVAEAVFTHALYLARQLAATAATGAPES